MDNNQVVEMVAPVDTVICIDRSLPLNYPPWVLTVMHQELIGTGPPQYDLSQIELWFHDRQRGDCRGRHEKVDGNDVYKCLKSSDMLKSCLNLADGEEIKKKGVVVFEQFFGIQDVFLWQSVVRNGAGFLLTPYLFEFCGDTSIGWRYLHTLWDIGSPAAHFAA